MSAGVTMNIQLDQLARRMHISYFRGVFMCNALPISGIHRNESGVNLDNARGPGTHWVAYAKRDNHVIYFDSFGNLRPPKERAIFRKWCDKDRVQSNTLSNLQEYLWTTVSAVSPNGRCVSI